MAEKNLIGRKLVEEMEQVKKQIIESPEKIEAQMKEKNSKLDKTKYSIQENKEKLNICSNLAETCSSTIKAQDGALNELKTILAIYYNIVELREKGKAEKHSCEEKSRERDRLLKQTNAINEEMKNTNELLSTTRQKCVDRRHDLENKRSSANGNHGKFLDKKQEQNNKVTNIEYALQNLDNSIQSKLTQTEDLSQQILLKVEMLKIEYCSFVGDIQKPLHHL